MVEKKSVTADSCVMSRTWPSVPAGSSAKARSTLVFLLDATMTEAPSAEAALAVAIPNPEVPPIMTTRCPSKLRLSKGRAGRFVCCMTTNIGEASTILFYDKIPAGRAALISMDYLRVQHYPKHHRPLRKCSALAQRIYERLRLDPLTTGSLRKELDMTGRPQRNRFDRALRELQVTLNIARRNSLEDENDTWVLFSDQYLDLVQTVSAAS
jgi:hypothetical protein